MRYTFVIPPVASFVSGGNLYNQSFTEALGRIAEVQLYSLDEWMDAKEDETAVIIDSIYLSKLNAAEMKRGKKRLLLLHYLDVFYDCKNDRDRMNKTLEQLRCFDYFIVTSQFVRTWLRAHGINPESIFVFEPVVALTRHKSTPITDHPLKVVMLGNLLPVKGFVEFLTELNQQQPRDLQVLIVGDASIDQGYASTVYQLIASSEYLRKTVTCKSAIPHNQVFDLLDESDLFVSSSQFETFGMAIHEALAFHLPVAALASGNINHIKHPALTLFHTMPALVSCLHLENRTQLVSLPERFEMQGASLSWDQHASLLHACFSGLKE